MAHYVVLSKDNIVTFIFVGKDENDLEPGINDWEEFYNAKRTSYNTRGGIHYGSDNLVSEDQSKAFRKNYAGIGYTYDEQRDAFIPPSPYPSWILDEFSCLWNPPVPYPDTEYIPSYYLSYNLFYWSEESLGWNLHKPFPSWTLTEDDYYIPPRPYPDPSILVYWNEDSLSWV
jgi:hypothetical protein